MILEHGAQTSPATALAIKTEARRLGLGGTKPTTRSHTTTATADATTELRDEVRRADAILNWGAR